MIAVYTVSETRRARLEMLIEKHGSVANVNTLLGWSRTDPKLTQIRNANARKERAKPYQMGDNMSREIEYKLGLAHGWMDTPPTVAERYGEEDLRSKVLQLMEAMPPEQWPTVVRLVNALAHPSSTSTSTALAPAINNIQNFKYV